MKRPDVNFKLLETLGVMMNFWVWFTIATVINGMVVYFLPLCLRQQQYALLHVGLLALGGIAFWYKRNFFKRPVNWFFALLVINILVTPVAMKRQATCTKPVRSHEVKL
jgi:hypothetical protein